uniref:Uncharacterized protein n=1 Tax=Anopheles christyi TaxID=43041 RepID=A0A182KHY2_9DIPT
MVTAHFQRICLFENGRHGRISVDELGQEVFVCQLHVRGQRTNLYLAQRFYYTLGPATLNCKLGDPGNQLDNAAHCLHAKEPQLHNFKPVLFVLHRHHQSLRIVRFVNVVRIPQESNRRLDVAADGEIILLDLGRLLFEQQ